MSLAALLATLAASGAFAVFDALRKRLSAEVPATALVAVLTTGQFPFLCAWLVVSGDDRFAWSYALPGGVTIVLNVAANLLFVRSLQLSPLSVSIPFLSFTPVFSTLFSAVVLGELPGERQQIGIALVVAGALLVNLQPDDGPSPTSVLRGMLRERGSLLMVIVALLWSLTGPVDKLALRHASAPVHGTLQTAGVALGLFALLALQGRLATLRRLPRHGWSFGFATLAGAAGIGLQLVAFQLALVGVVEAIKRAIGMAAAVVVGRFAFAEHYTPGKLAGVALMTPGVALIVV